MVALITIKKPDGTIEKITLEEFKARKNKSAKPTPAVTIKKAPAAPPKPAIISKPPKSEEASSLLEEITPQKNVGALLVSNDKKKEADDIIKKLNLTLAPHLVDRLRRQIALRIKDVRGEDEAREWLIRPERELGVGLNEAQAEIVLKACRDYLAKTTKAPVPAVAPLKKSIPPTALRAEEEALPQKYSAPKPPAAAAPFNAFVRAPEVKEVKKFDELLKMRDQAGALEQQPKPAAPVRPLVRDITPARQSGIGPVDEIKYITLTDFRRLSAVPAEAAARLKQKFVNLRDESYILFLDALDAWKMSPLRADYLSRVNEAINLGRPLETIAADKEKIQLNEIKALIEMEKELG